MTAIKKITALSVPVFIIIMSMCSCSKPETPQNDGALTDEEINSRYEQIINEAEEELLPEDYNPIVDNFTTVDFQLTMTDDTTAFNLPENSYATITATAAKFSFFDSSARGESFAGSFKTAKGLSLANTVADYLSAYKVDAPNAVYHMQGVGYPSYDSMVDTTAARVTFGFSSNDGQAFSLLGADEIKRILQIRDPLKESGASVDTQAIANIVASYQTVAIIDVTPTENGTLSEVSISRFDNTTQE